MLFVLKFNWIAFFSIAAFPFNYEIQTVLAIFRLECSPGWCGNKGIIYYFSVSTRREERGIYFNNSHIISLPAFPGWWRQTLLQPKPRGVLLRLGPDHATLDKVVAMIQLQLKVVICLFGSGKVCIPVPRSGHWSRPAWFENVITRWILNCLLHSRYDCGRNLENFNSYLSCSQEETWETLGWEIC